MGKKKDVSIQDQKQIIFLYKNQLKTVWEISELMNYSRTVIDRILKENNIQKRRAIRRNKYYINQYYFDKIDSEDKAYFLGLLYADGYNNTDGFKFSLEMIDRDVLEKFKFYLNTNYPIKKSKVTKSGNQCYRLRVYNKYMSEALSLKGMTNKKTFTLTFPEWLNRNYYKDFIRGYFDGDGSIFTRGYSTSLCGNHQFCLKVMEIINSELQKEIFNLYKKSNIYELRTTKKEYSKMFLDYLYKDSKVYLDRKYFLYLKLYCNNA